ncbi:hypothetical protein MBLNU457_6882t2 [Dothideomycetes sp. NU457]
MSREHDFAAPPTPGRASFFSRFRDSHMPSRLATVNQGISGPSSNSPPPAPSAAFSLVYASPTSSQGQTLRRSPAARPYYPRQWSQPGTAGASSSTSPSTHAIDVSGMEASLPSPPPPYRSPDPDSMHRMRRSNQLRAGLSPVTSPLHAVETLSAPLLSQVSSYDDQANCVESATAVDLATMSTRATAHDLSRREDGRDADRYVHSPQQQSLEFTAVPPAARRAHSMGAVGVVSQPSLQNVQHHSGSAWRQGQPLPPPPPGPPPSARSQSLHRPIGVYIAQPESTQQRHVHSTSPNMIRASSLVSPLSPIPPTPTNWEENNDVDMAHSCQTSVNNGPEFRPIDALVRRSARREPSADGIRERRSRSKTMRDSAISASGIELEHSTNGNSAVTALGPPDLVILPISRSSKTTSTVASTSRQLPKSTNVSPSDQRTTIPPKSLSILTPPYTPTVRQKADTHGVLSNTYDQRTSNLQQTPSEQDEFFHASLDRYLKSSQQESEATSDSDRLRIFAAYIVAESRLRRDRYSNSFDEVAINLFDITRDLWRPLNKTPTRATGPPASRDMSLSSTGQSVEECSEASALTSSQASIVDMTPATDVPSCDGSDYGDQDDNDYSARLKKFQPTLSPIPSMAMSSVPDESSSRGRSASRWWEASDEGSNGEGARRLERPRTELKYMSLHPGELQAAAQPSPATSTPTTGASHFRTETDIYPTEKVGPHDNQDYDLYSHSPVLEDSRVSVHVLAAPTGPPLDISRLVTLPPPYPRHYPAVNNCHPMLEDSRQKQRELADLDHLRSLKQSFEVRESEWCQKLKRLETERKQQFTSKLQSDVDHDTISPAAARSAREQFKRDEVRRAMYAEYESQQRFDKTVKNPGEAFLYSKIADANVSINMMLLVLSREENSGHSERTQISGDEEPELLEQLTLLKWLFEAREQLHKESFDLSQQSMRLCGAPDHETLDNALRQTFAKASASRFADLQATFSLHVSNGVEAQISAFWDIAPQLLDLIQQIPLSPSALQTLQIAVPPSEIIENPSYESFPQQYLYSTLSHAQKSSYQFIEAQINLLCLLHEVQVATAAAETRIQEVERGQGMDEEGRIEVKSVMERRRREREEELTRELKDRVGEVEVGWNEALGHAVEETRRAVRGFLEEVGGWDEGLE